MRACPFLERARPRPSKVRHPGGPVILGMEFLLAWDVSQGCKEIAPPDCCLKSRAIFGPPTPRVSQWKNIGSGSVEFKVLTCGGICVKFLEGIFLEIEGRKSARNFAKTSPRFSRVFWNWQKKLTRTSLWGTNATRFCGGAVKIAAATAGNRAILVHSALH